MDKRDIVFRQLLLEQMTVIEKNKLHDDEKRLGRVLVPAEMFARFPHLRGGECENYETLFDSIISHLPELTIEIGDLNGEKYDKNKEVFFKNVKTIKIKPHKIQHWFSYKEVDFVHRIDLALEVAGVNLREKVKYIKRKKREEVYF